MVEPLIAIGKITTTHGHRGEVRVYPLTDFPERFQRLGKVYVQKEDMRELHVERARFHKQFVIVKFKEINDMNEALQLKDYLIKINRSEVVPLPEGHYYIFQLVGSEVYSDKGEFLGELVDVHRTGSNDVYVVQNPDTGEEILIPALKDVVKKIDLEENKLVVELLPGLRE